MRFKVLAVTFGLLAVITLIGVGGSGYGTYHAFAHRYTNGPILIHGESIIALEDILPYYITTVDILQNPWEDEGSHRIDFYLVDTACQHLNWTTKYTEHTITNASSIENITGLYLLPGSKISYNICAVTDASSDQDVRVELYLLDNLDAAKTFDPLHQAPTKGFPVLCRENDTEPCLCKSFVFNIDHIGYYSVRFVAHDPESAIIRYNYIASLLQKKIVSPPNKFLFHCSVSNEQHCTFHFNSTLSHLPHEMNEEQCIIADIHEPVDILVDKTKPDFSHVKVNFVLYPINWFAMSVAFLGACTLVLIVVVIIEIVICCKVFKK